MLDFTVSKYSDAHFWNRIVSTNNWTQSNDADWSLMFNNSGCLSLDATSIEETSMIGSRRKIALTMNASGDLTVYMVNNENGRLFGTKDRTSSDNMPLLIGAGMADGTLMGYANMTVHSCDLYKCVLDNDIINDFLNQ